MRILYLSLLLGLASTRSGASPASHVIVISVDGLRPAALDTLGETGAPTFHRLQAEGTWTHNARTDHGWTLTGPNHSSMVTGRPVDGDEGHNYTANGTPPVWESYHRVKDQYVASMFDVAHDHGLKTGFYYSKSKLNIITQSYSAAMGAEDSVGEDNGTLKIDVSKANGSLTSDEITAELVADLPVELFGLTFVHLIDPDPVGHGPNWETQAYYAAVAAADGYIGNIIAAIEAKPELADDTVLIVTTDHGGGGGGAWHLHGDATAADNYTIPFYVWGAGVTPGADLYAINSSSRTDPETERIPFTAAMQPIRNSDCANLALSCLGLPAIPGSTVNSQQDLRISAPPAGRPHFECEISLDGGLIQLGWPTAGEGFEYTVEIYDGDGWTAAPGDWPIPGTSWTDTTPPPGSRIYRVRAEK